jgi:hypothetical protein
VIERSIPRHTKHTDRVRVRLLYGVIGDFISLTSKFEGRGVMQVPTGTTLILYLTGYARRVLDQQIHFSHKLCNIKHISHPVNLLSTQILSYILVNMTYSGGLSFNFPPSNFSMPSTPQNQNIPPLPMPGSTTPTPAQPRHLSSFATNMGESPFTDSHPTITSAASISPLVIDNLAKDFELEDRQKANLHAFVKVFWFVSHYMVAHTYFLLSDRLC